MTEDRPGCDPIDLRILTVLVRDWLTVPEIVDRLDLPRKTIEAHLSKLESGEWVVRRLRERASVPGVVPSEFTNGGRFFALSLAAVARRAPE